MDWHKNVYGEMERDLFDAWAGICDKRESYEEYDAMIRERWQRDGRKIRWETYDGRTIQVMQMSDLHILNSKQMIERSGLDSVWIEIFNEEIRQREVETL